MLPSCRPARDTRLLLWRVSRCVSASRHASHAPRPKAAGKRLDQWTPEEVAGKLRGLEEQVDRGQTPNPQQLAVLLPPIRHYKNPEDLSRMLRVVHGSEVTLNESLGSALVSGLAEEGRIKDIKVVLQKMQGHLRVQSLALVLSLACREVDAGLGLEYLAKWNRTQELPEHIVRSLVALSRESGRPEVVERLLEILWDTRQTVGTESAAEFRLWAESQPQPFTVEETTISSSGVCTSCKGHLEKALTGTEHQQLLDAVTTAVHSEGLGFSPELISMLSRLQRQLASTPTPYRVVVDGLNVSHVASKNFNAMDVMDVVNKLTKTLGGPILVVARKHLVEEMDELASFYSGQEAAISSMPCKKDFQVFTTQINEISDDVCVIYASLTMGQRCYFVSNDHMSDNKAMLSPSQALLFSMWQASRQITVRRNKLQLLYPADHSQRAQCSQAGWHIPLSQATPTTYQDAWRMLGRQRWEDRESTDPWAVQGRAPWLCIRSI